MTIETVLDIEARLPPAVRRSIARFDGACQAIGGGLGGSGEEARCYREGRYNDARVNLVSDIDAAIGAQIRALDTREAALDEARGRIEALEREVEILREVLENLEARRLPDELDEAYAVIAGHREARRVLSEQVDDLAAQNLELRKQLLSAACRAAVAT